MNCYHARSVKTCTNLHIIGMTYDLIIPICSCLTGPSTPYRTKQIFVVHTCLQGQTSPPTFKKAYALFLNLENPPLCKLKN